MVISVTKGGTVKLPLLPKKNLRLSKPPDVTIHWKALEDHFLMVPLDFHLNHFWRKHAFSGFL
jgi:hypothetical protein